MVAKAGYALQKGFFSPESILLLSFNNAAAAELRERIKARLEPLGLAGERVSAKTFHAFGLDVIGQATGRRPSIAPWLESGQDIDALMRMVDDLKDEQSWFRTSWDMFRVVFGQVLRKGVVSDDVGPAGYFVAYEVVKSNLTPGMAVVVDCPNPLSVIGPASLSACPLAQSACPGGDTVQAVSCAPGEIGKRLQWSRRDLDNFLAILPVQWGPLTPHGRTVAVRMTVEAPHGPFEHASWAGAQGRLLMRLL